MIKRVLWALTGLVIIVLGLSIIFGCWKHIFTLVLPESSDYLMVCYIGCSFLLCGLGINCCAFTVKWVAKLQIVLGSVLIVSSVLVLSQDIFSIYYDLNQFIIKNGWTPTAIPFQHLTLNTALGFILSGMIFIMLPYAYKKWVAITVECSIFLLFLLGILSVIGHFIRIEFLYDWYQYISMSIITAMGFAMVGIVLWAIWRNSPYSVQLYRGKEDQKITILSSIILLFISLVVGLASFITLANQQIELIRHTFEQTLQAKKSVLIAAVTQATNEFSAIENNLLLAPTNLHQGTLTQVGICEKFFIAEGFSGVLILDSQKRVVEKRGVLINDPDVIVRLAIPKQVELFWKNGWYIRISNDVVMSGKGIYHVTAERALMSVDNSFKEIETLGKTSAMGVCALADNNQAICFPSRFVKMPVHVSLNNENQQLPINFAFSGKVGTTTTYDFTHHRVLAAYSPVGQLGLGMVLKIDMSELYAPIMEKLRVVLPFVLIAVLIGLLLLRLEVIPLIQRIFRAERDLMKSNELLTESEKRYELAVRGSNSGLWDWAVGTDNIFYSPYLKNMLGYTNEELPNSLQAFTEHLHPDDAKRVSHAIEEHLLYHVPYNIEYRLKRHSGEYHWFQAVGQAEWDAAGQAIRMAGSLIDINDRKVTEQRLATQYIVTQILSEIISIEDAVPKVIQAICKGLHWSYGAIWLVNTAEKHLDYMGFWHHHALQIQDFIQATKDTLPVFGVSKVGQVWSTGKFYWVQDIATETNMPVAQNALYAGFSSAFFFPILLQNRVFGVMEFFNAHMDSPDEKLLQMMAAIGPQIGQFIQRKRMEKELRDSETHKTAILHSASDSIITMNNKGFIVSFNLQTEKMFGFRHAELARKNIYEIIPGLEKRLNALIGEPPTEFIGLQKDGTSFSVELAISGMDMHQQTLVVIIRDITERKRIETLKNEFVSVVSHELRTPLTSIRGSLGLILGGAVGTFSEKAAKLLNIANNNCERLLHLINDILDIEKIEAGKMNFHLQQINIIDLIKESIATNQPYADKYNVKVKLADSVREAWVNVDPDRLMQVMANLISNAVKFSSTGGVVIIDVQSTPYKVWVAVIDNGQGIPEEFQSRIFQKFSQADSTNTRVKGGTGLGLSICKAIIEKLEGKIGFVSKPQIGSTFYFELPPCQKANTAVNDEDAKRVASRQSLLICEDDEDQANYLRVMLEGTGFSVDVAFTVEEARKLLLEKEYQGLLLDLILPDQDGIAFIRELRSQEKTRLLPIVVLSIIAQTGRSLLNGDAFSVLDWLDKPVDFNKLLKDILFIKSISSQKISKILHVEDDPEISKVVQSILHNGTQVVIASTLKQANELLTKEKFDLAILDLMLPDGDGTELLPILAKHTVPIIVFSSGKLDHQYAKYVQEVFVKSEISYDELLKTIEKILWKM